MSHRLPATMLIASFFVPAFAGHQAWSGDIVDRKSLRREGLDALKAAVKYEFNPAVRVAAVEALEASALEESLPWIRLALKDDHPAVRFAACIAVARRNDKVSRESAAALTSDPDPNVRVAALFARHRLVDDSLTGKMPPFLLENDDVSVRRNAAMVFGLMDEPGAVKVLARAMSDRDPSVRHYALEALARLGNKEATQELAFMTNTGVGSEEVFAINALAETRDRQFRDTYRYKLSTGTHLETRLAAARALGMLGLADGLEQAIRGLESPGVRTSDPEDPPSSQVVRARVMAAAALGAIGRSDGLSILRRMLRESGDPRLQVAAAKAVLEIIKANPRPGLPFGLNKGD